MKTIQVMTVVAGMSMLSVFAVLQAQSSSGAAGATAADEAVLKAEQQRFAAMRSADASTLEKLLAPELSYTHSNASVQDKAAFIADIKSGAIKYLMIEPADMKVHVLGNTAVVTGGASVHVIQNGADLTFRIRYTNVHVNRAGSWQMVAWQATRLPA
jgi:ketosteroid isomerase-like protein